MVSLKLELAESGLSFMLDVRVRRDDLVYGRDTLAVALFSRFENGSAIGPRVSSSHYS